MADRDMLVGRGLAPALMPPAVIQQAQDLALAAFRGPAAAVRRHQAKDGESFMQFVDRLKEAIDASPNLTAEAKGAVLKDLVVTDANSQRQQIIASLGRDASLTAIIEACLRILVLTTEEVKARAQAAAFAMF